LLAIPEFLEFLNKHNDDYISGDTPGDCSIPRAMIDYIDLIRNSKVFLMSDAKNGPVDPAEYTVDPSKFRESICENSTNTNLMDMRYGQHDSGEFLKLMLEYFQYYTKYHFNLGCMLFDNFSTVICNEGVESLFVGEIINPMLKIISDFNTIELLNADLFFEILKTKIHLIKVKVAKAKLKQAYHKNNTIALFSYAKIVADLVGQDKEDFLGKINSFIAACKDVGIGEPLGLLNRLSNKGEINELELDTLQECFGQDKELAWFLDKVKCLNFNINEEQYLIKYDFNILSDCLEKMHSPDIIDKLAQNLDKIRETLLAFRNVFGLKINGDWHIGIHPDLPFNNLDKVSTLIKSNKNNFPMCYAQDLLNQDKNRITAILPEVLILQFPSFANEDTVLPAVGGFEVYMKKNPLVPRHTELGHKFPISFNPGLNLIIGQQNYELIGMIYHAGDTNMGGHYIAACKYDKWVTFNDATVMPFNGDYICENLFNPYVAIYRKVH
jgi:hypothetical protein